MHASTPQCGPPPRLAPRAALWPDLYGLFLVAVLLALFVVFFAVLLGLFFELFRFVDLLLNPERPLDWPLALRAALVILVSLVLVRLAICLARAILGLVTSRVEGRSQVAETLLLDREQHVALYALVAEVCRALLAPVPDAIRLNPWPECFVIEERRFAWHPDRQLTLVLGCPHLLVLTIDELRVIVVHEMAHLRRGDATLSVFVYRFHESLEQAVVQLRSRWWHGCDPLYWFFVAFSQIVCVASAPLQRHQELRADQLSAELCGSDLATHTLLKEWLVAHEFALSAEHVEAAPEVSSSPATTSRDSPPTQKPTVFRHFTDRWREFSPDAEKYLAQRLTEEESPDYFDSHPLMRVRLEAMKRYPPAAALSPRPARELLSNWETLEQQLDQLPNP